MSRTFELKPWTDAFGLVHYTLWVWTEHDAGRYGWHRTLDMLSPSEALSLHKATSDATDMAACPYRECAWRGSLEAEGQEIGPLLAHLIVAHAGRHG